MYYWSIEGTDISSQGVMSTTGGIIKDILGDSSTHRVIDTSRYEVIEKPEWKKKMLEQEIETLENKIEHYEGQVKRLLSIETELKNKKKELKKQLKSLDIEAE